MYPEPILKQLIDGIIVLSLTIPVPVDTKTYGLCPNPIMSSIPSLFKSPAYLGKLAKEVHPASGPNVLNPRVSCGKFMFFP